MLGGKLSWYYLPGERLPTEAELAEYFQVSRPTVRKALLETERSGLVRSRQGAGWFAADDPPRLTGRTVGIVCEDVPEPSPWFVGGRESQQLAGIRRTLARAGYDVTLRMVNDRIREAAGDWAKVCWPDLLDFRNVRGVLVFWRSGHRRLNVIDALREYAPLVAAGAGTDAGRGEASMDVATGVFQSFNHLLCLGHRRIAYVGTGPAPPVNEQRHIAIRLVEQSASGGGALVSRRFEPRSVSPAEGARLADAVLDDPGRFTAAHVTARELGEGFYERLRKRGARVPEDFSLVVEAEDGAGFETIPSDATHVAFDYLGLGDRSAELLLKIIAAPRAKQSVDPVSTSFVAGSTTGAPPGGAPVTGARLSGLSDAR